MCGIAGQVRADGRPVERAVLEAMCEGLRHRGPDSRGIHIDSEAGIGIQRLAVIDLRTGDQPIFNEDRTVAVVLNGEIYNYRELREELAARGHRLASEGDTEVIVHLYEELGERCVERLHGMFAFALWDARDRSLLIARDRIGKKPLLYGMREGNLSFASEMGALLADRELPREIDPHALDAYLGLQYVPAPLSIFSSVRKLEPGSLLRWRDGELSTERYWRLAYRPKLRPAAAELGEAIREQITAAVQRRLVSDVPLGAFLSGGIDSSAVVAAMARVSSGAVKTFSIGFADERHSELPQAAMVAERYGTDHHTFVVEPNAVEILPSVVRHYGEPYADTSAIPSFYVSEMARREVTVALNGDGGDECFAGYHRYVAEMRADAVRMPRPLRKLAGVAGRATAERGDPMRSLNRARRAAKQLGMDPLARHQKQMSVFDPGQRDALYSDAFRATLSPPRPEDLLADAWHAASGTDLLDRLLEVDVNTYLPGDLCFKIDIATMAYGLEARSPFLDHELMEFAAALPPEDKLDGRETKVALRNALREWLPPEILDAPKRGFGMPVATEWLRGELRGFITDVLLDQRSLARGYFRPESVEGLLDDHVEGRADNAQRLWTLMMLELWQREFVDG